MVGREPTEKAFTVGNGVYYVVKGDVLLWADSPAWRPVRHESGAGPHVPIEPRDPLWAACCPTVSDPPGMMRAW